MFNITHEHDVALNMLRKAQENGGKEDAYGQTEDYRRGVLAGLELVMNALGIMAD